MQNFFLYANTGKPETLPAVRKVAEALLTKQAGVFLDHWLFEHLGIGISGSLAQLRGASHAVICFGGDGTLLRVLPTLAARGLPVIGVNMGHTGFLMETSPEDLISNLDRLIAGDFTIHQRGLLSCVINGGAENLVMNEVALTRGSNPSSLVLDVSFEGELVYTIHGDGVLVSSPTGTTGYCLSAGGPVAHPEVACRVVAPICSHIMHQRPMVLPGDGEITLRVRANRGMAHQISMDGQMVMNLEGNSEVFITPSSHTAGFIRFEPQRFLTRLHQKQMEWSNHVYGGLE